MVRSATSTDAGATWSGVRDVAVPTGQMFNSPAIMAAADASNVDVGWYSGGLNPTIKVATSTDRGASWSLRDPLRLRST